MEASALVLEVPSSKVRRYSSQGTRSPLYIDLYNRRRKNKKKQSLTMQRSYNNHIVCRCTCGQIVQLLQGLSTWGFPVMAASTLPLILDLILWFSITSAVHWLARTRSKMMNFFPASISNFRNSSSQAVTMRAKWTKFQTFCPLKATTAESRRPWVASYPSVAWHASTLESTTSSSSIRDLVPKYALSNNLTGELFKLP